MSDFFSKLSRAVDAFSDVITEDADSMKKVPVYRLCDFQKFFAEHQKAEPKIQKCTISISEEREFDGIVFPERKFLIRIVLLDQEGQPIPLENSTEELMGDILLADGIDEELRDFMAGKKVKTVRMRGEK